jgi:hypothetical protein
MGSRALRAGLYLFLEELQGVRSTGPVDLANAPDLIRNDGVGSSNLSCGTNGISNLQNYFLGCDG